MTTRHRDSLPGRPVHAIARASAMALLFMLLALLAVPATAFAQATSTPVPTRPAEAEHSATPRAAASLVLSTSSGLAGATITANGSAFRPGESVEVTFNGQPVGSPTVNDGGSFSLSFSVPMVQPGQFGMLARGVASGSTATAAFTVNQGSAALSFSAPQSAPAASLTVTSAGFQPGETVQVWFNGAPVGTATVDTAGSAMVTFVVPTLAAGQYDVTATGQTSGVTTTVPYTVLAAGTPVPEAAVPIATATPAPAVAAPPAGASNAPAMVHDDRYFAQTGYRVENDQMWAFFQEYGGPSAFGYPVSRPMTLLGCPVQMFQRHIIQVCSGQGGALINLLDPEIFPYTQVNGSTFPGPDPTMKNNTPQVGSPTYAEDINTFIQANVPDVSNGAPVNFLQTYNALGGLTIWGAPISSPAPEPTNPNFIYQRFQRGIMHYIAGSGTQSILLADYLKAIIMNQNVPADLLQQSRESRYFNQYCPDQPMSVCRPSELPGTDLTFAFVSG